MSRSRPHRHLVGLIGSAIQASRTPALHEKEAAAHGIRLCYQLIDLDRIDGGAAALPRVLDSAELLGFTGCNVTHPCKQSVIAHLDELSDDAAAIGAVNTVLFVDGRRIGHNTDWWGFAENFQRGLVGASMKSAVQIGAGGAGAAIAYALLKLGVERLALHDLADCRASTLGRRLAKHFGDGRAAAVDDVRQAIADATGLINTTPVGMLGHPGLPVPIEVLRPDLWVAEVVYFPLETELLRAARAAGCRTLGGGGMAVFQAVKAFELFTGRAADADRMLRHFASM